MAHSLSADQLAQILEVSAAVHSLSQNEQSRRQQSLRPKPWTAPDAREILGPVVARLVERCLPAGVLDGADKQLIKACKHAMDVLGISHPILSEALKTALELDSTGVASAGTARRVSPGVPQDVFHTTRQSLQQCDEAELVQIVRNLDASYGPVNVQDGLLRDIMATTDRLVS